MPPKEEGLAGTAGYECCTFRGAVVALDVRTGRILWKTYMVPSNNDGSDINLPGFYSGNGVWGSSPVVDTQRGLLYVGTANNFSAPPGVCLTPSRPTVKSRGRQSLRFDRRLTAHATARSSGSTRTLRADVFSAQCFVVPTSTSARRPICSPPPTRAPVGRGRCWASVRRAAIYWALNPDDGSVVWSTKVGPGGLGGGVEFGTATDGERIYVAEANSSQLPFTLSGTGPFAGMTVTSGYWSALNPATGAILWQTPDPQGSKNPGFVTVANGVVYAGSAAGCGGNMYALDAQHGRRPVELSRAAGRCSRRPPSCTACCSGDPGIRATGRARTASTPAWRTTSCMRSVFRDPRRKSSRPGARQRAPGPGHPPSAEPF